MTNFCVSLGVLPLVVVIPESVGLIAMGLVTCYVKTFSS